MEKIFNWLSIIIGTVGGCLIALLGGWDNLIVALLTLMCLDYVTGLIKAIYQKELSSKIGFKGILKKILVLVIVSVSSIAENHFGVPAVREMVIMFFAFNEALSVLENADSIGLPLPKKLKQALIQIRDEKGGNKDE